VPMRRPGDDEAAEEADAAAEGEPPVSG
jgi:hypothetical protein